MTAGLPSGSVSVSKQFYPFCSENLVQCLPKLLAELLWLKVMVYIIDI